MVDPKRITNFNRSDYDLEELIIFSICVAGHNAHATASSVDCFLNYLFIIKEFPRYPLAALLTYTKLEGLNNLQKVLKKCGIGCYTSRALACYNLAEKVGSGEINLRTCKPEDLEKIKGIGSKTSRFFILHSRPAQNIAALDTHIMKYLREKGLTDRKTTPAKGSKAYSELEWQFIKLCGEAGKTVAEMDLEIWNKFSLDGLGNRATIVKKRKINGS